jgi:hypothetical protein
MLLLSRLAPVSQVTHVPEKIPFDINWRHRAADFDEQRRDRRQCNSDYRCVFLPTAGVGRDIKLPTYEPGFQLYCTVTAIAKAVEDGFEISQKKMQGWRRPGSSCSGPGCIFLLNPITFPA